MSLDFSKRVVLLRNSDGLVRKKGSYYQQPGPMDYGARSSRIDESHKSKL